MGLNVFGANSPITWWFTNGAALLAWLLAGLLVPARAADLKNEGEGIVQSTCVGCHRIQGAPMPRSTKEAPDLIWAGNKYQPGWLVAWLENPKEKLYPVGYDFKFKRKGRQLALSFGEAEQVADF
jgi:mono/diheme cytochrome c family protein